jgi:NAD(P)-dependent dehydrogenase (short-subunit alcohol dehydrogenase family)
MSEHSKQLFPGKIATVTGGSRRIGRNAVESLAKRGVQAIFTYSQPQRRCGGGCCRREG